MKFESIDSILDFAISKEEEAEALYLNMAELVERPGMAEAFSAFAAEEAGHRQRLLKLKAGKLPVMAAGAVQSLGIADTLTEVVPSTNMTYQEALRFAMQAEKAAFKLYEDLAAAVEDSGWAEVFHALAQEEAKHKLRFEIEYDEVVLEGN